MSEARLFIVATPIGNLEDITLRALKVLSEVDVIAAEDTRRSRLLLSRHGLDRPLVSLHEHNEVQQAPVLVNKLLAGQSLALVSDAGTPVLSDPGFRLVRLAVEAGIEVVAIPGPSSITSALSVAGLPTDRFVFEGFLPSKQSARLQRLGRLKAEQRTMVFFESSHRIEVSLADLEQSFGDERQAVLCREMTKQFETVLRGTLTDLRRQVENDVNQRRGEFVLLVAGSETNGEERFQAALGLARELDKHLGASQAARIAARIHGVPRRDLYRELGDQSKVPES